MEIISLGGVGGCQLATTLREHNYPAYPYDWLITTQSFIIDSFDNIDNFFIFDNAYVCKDIYLLDRHKRAIMLHDFTHFETQKVSTIEKYTRRFHRLHEALTSGKKILFVRLMDNLNVDASDSTMITREEENISLWELFIQHVIDTYKCPCHLLLITDEHKYNTKPDTYKNITISYTDNKIVSNISSIINQFVQSSKN
jgi:Putative papain-like cysteine peptidase (DUF1796)